MGNLFGTDVSENGRLQEFGDFCFDLGNRTLWRNGSPVDLTPRAADLLAVLLERRGQLLERTELIETVWKDTVVEEGNLSYTISVLRKVLGKNADGGDFIQTVPRRGYRFTSPPPLGDEIEVIYERRSQTVVEEIHISHTEPTAASPFS